MGDVRNKYNGWVSDKADNTSVGLYMDNSKNNKQVLGQKISTIKLGDVIISHPLPQIFIFNEIFLI